jgi:anti-sigma factor RsiW
MTCTKARGLLDWYMDGELGVEGSLALERHLETCRSCAARLASWRALSAGARDKLSYYAAPSALQRALRDELTRRESISTISSRTRRAPPAWLRLAASFILVAGLSSALTFYATPNTGDAIPDEVFASHVRSTQSENRLIDIVSSDEHTVKPWLDARLDFAPPVKDLSADGFPLVGGRVDYIGGRAVAVLVYQYRKHLITLFIWPSNGQAKPVSASVRRGDLMAEWSDGAMTYWAISDVAAPEFTEFYRRFQDVEAGAESQSSTSILRQ